MTVRPSIRFTVCVFCLGEQHDEFVQFFLEMVEEVQGRVSQIPNKYFDVFDVTHVKHMEIFPEENVA